MAKAPVVVVAAAVVVSVMVVAMQEAGAARILMAKPIGTRSHKNFYIGIAESLARRNHTVTLVTSFKSPRERPNIREIIVSGVNAFDELPNMFNTTYTRRVQMTLDIWPAVVTSCSRALGASEVQAAVQEGFDLVMLYTYMTDCFLSVAHTLKAPFIYVTPNMVHGAIGDLAGTPDFPSLRPAIGLDPESTSGRMVNVLSTVAYDFLNNWVYLPSMESDCRARQLCPEDMPALTKLRLNGSLLITNSVRTMENPTLPYTPTVVHAGGIHCRPAEPLPEDLQQWVAGAGRNGFVFFSLGSLVKSSTLAAEYRKVLLEVFGSLQQRVLWKWDEDTIEGLPANVRLSKWLPQQDILGHPQLRLFITHGGLFSTLEATYHGVPLLGMPVAIDQHSNMRAVKREGWGRVLQWQDLTYDSLRGHILEMMDDSSLKEKALQRSRVMRDQPVSPGDWVTFWVEYVLRHQGARHLHSPARDMPWYQLYNVDVWAVVVMVTVVVAGLGSWLSYKALRALPGCFCGSSKTKKE